MATCAPCGLVFVPPTPSRPTTYCSRKCAASVRAAARRTVAGVGSQSCALCGGPFMAVVAIAKFCSRSCYDRYHKRRGPSYALHKREALTQNQRITIFERDNWTCYLCDRRLERDEVAPHPLSPTIDHVRPFARSGPTTSENLRAAHWQCNVDKGDGEVPWWVAGVA